MVCKVAQHARNIQPFLFVPLIFGIEGIDDVLDRHGDVPATPAEGIDELVPNDGRNPRSDWTRLIPCAALQMNRKKYLLDDIFHVGCQGAVSLAATTSHRAQRRRYTFQEAAVGNDIAQNRGMQPYRPFLFARLTIHAPIPSTLAMPVLLL